MGRKPAHPILITARGVGNSDFLTVLAFRSGGFFPLLRLFLVALPGDAIQYFPLPFLQILHGFAQFMHLLLVLV